MYAEWGCFHSPFYTEGWKPLILWLAAAATAAVVVVVTAAAANEDDQDDDPETAIATETVTKTRHKSTSYNIDYHIGLPGWQLFLKSAAAVWSAAVFLIAVKPLCTLIAATVVKTGDVSLISAVAATADDQDYNYNPPAIVSSESTSVSKHIV